MRSAIVVLTRWIASAFMTLHPWQCAQQANAGWLHWQLFGNEFAAAPISSIGVSVRQEVESRISFTWISIERGTGIWNVQRRLPGSVQLGTENWTTFADFSVSSAMSLR